MRLQVSVAMTVKITIYWDAVSCSMKVIYGCLWVGKRAYFSAQKMVAVVFCETLVHLY
jgi:hypothetical protein